MFRLSRGLRLRSQYPTAIFRASQRYQSKGVHSDDAPANIQHVHFHKPPFYSPVRVATFLIYSGCFAGYLYYLSGQFGVDFKEPEEEETTEQETVQRSDIEEEHDWSDEDSTFIPLTWAKKLPRQYYKGSDAEWQEFIKVSKDEKRVRAIHHELAGLMTKSIAEHPILARYLGKDIKIGKVWIDIYFPEGPPPEYSRKGLEIGDGFIAWSEERIPAEIQQRNNRILWPTGMLNSLYAYSATLFGFQYQKLKQALGVDSKATPGSPEDRANRLLQMLENKEANKQSQGLKKAQTSSGTSGIGDASTSTERSGLQSTTPDLPKGVSSSTQDADDRPWYTPPRVGLPGQPMEKTIALTVGVHALHKSWQEEKPEPPKGTFVLSGLAQLRGSRATITFDVQAFYDPGINRFVTVNVTPKMFKQWQQRPKGGP